MKALSTENYSEGYYFEGKKYLTRLEFFDSQRPETYFPQFYTMANRSSGAAGTMFDSIKKYLLRATANNTTAYLLYSGGIDSEIIFHTALELGLPVVPVIVDLFGINSYELQFAKKFLERHGIENYIRVEVSEEEYRRRWLAELIFDSESLSFILSGAYIAARSCPPGAPILYSGENPDVIHVKGRSAFFMRHEYSFWGQKTAQRHGLDLRELYTDPDVLKSLFAYPAIGERVFSGVPYAEWTADHEYLGKEYFYSDPDFIDLPRRYAQHGWESRKGSGGYQKGMRPLAKPNLHPKKDGHYLNTECAIPFLIHCLRTGKLDHDLGRRALFENYLVSDVSGIDGVYSHTFNRQFYVYLANLGDSCWHPMGDPQLTFTLSSNDGIIVSPNGSGVQSLSL